MFWNKRKEGEVKLAGPKTMPELVRKHLTDKLKKDTRLLTNLKAVTRDKAGNNAVEIRLFDEVEAEVREVAVENYCTLDTHPELVIYDGWFNNKSKEVKLEERKELKAAPEVKLLDEKQIRGKVEALSKPGETVFFYLGGSQCCGGPLGRGAAIAELNPNYPKEGKKYVLYVANVDGLEPVSKRIKIFDSDKSKQISSWIKDRHFKPGF